MTFKTYDILSSLIPGFVLMFVLMWTFEIKYDKDLIIAYTAISFIIGYFLNTLSSWFEDIYYFTWGGKPSSRLLDSKDIWKVRFYHTDKVRFLLSSESDKEKPSNDELFSIAMRYANGEKDSRVDDFNSNYAFSRVILTTVLFSTIFLLFKNYDDIRYYCFFIPLTILAWFRCKQRGYYYAREVLIVYLRIKTKNK